MADTDWLDAGNRLRELVLPLKDHGLVEVFVATEVADVQNLGQIVPAVHILYQGDRVVEGHQSGLSSKVDQQWLVLLTHRPTPGQATAGVWLHRLLSAIAGKSFGQSTFVRVNPSVRPSYKAGVAYLPLAFEVTLKFKGELS